MEENNVKSERIALKKLNLNRKGVRFDNILNLHGEILKKMREMIY